MNKKKKLILSAVLVLTGGMGMRWAWLFMYYNWSVVAIVLSALLFISGVILFAFTVFNTGA